MTLPHPPRIHRCGHHHAQLFKKKPNCLTACVSISHPHQPGVEVLVFPHPHQHLVSVLDRSHSNRNGTVNISLSVHLWLMIASLHKICHPYSFFGELHIDVFCSFYCIVYLLVLSHKNVSGHKSFYPLYVV